MISVRLEPFDDPAPAGAICPSAMHEYDIRGGLRLGTRALCENGATDRGDLVAIDQGSGHELVTLHLGSVPSRFTSPAIGYGRVVVGAGRVVLAFGH